MFTIDNADFRGFVSGLNTTIPLPSGRYTTAINFDNAATTPAFNYVLHEIIRFAPWYSSVHRGTGFKSQFSSSLYENSRRVVADFVNADLTNSTVIYLKNTTEAINKVSHHLCNSPEDIILSTYMEHHSNDLPWRGRFQLEYISIDPKGRLDLKDLKAKLEKYNGRVRLVAVTGASNVTGAVNPIHTIASLCHNYGSRILVDGAQLIPHGGFNMRPHDSEEHIDFLVFSAHKMYAPFGIGVLVAPKEVFEKSPDIVGGGTVDLVTHDYIKWAQLPQREEAGTPNLMGVIALISSIRVLKTIGMNKISAHELSLTGFLINELKKIEGIELYGDTESNNRVAIIPFNITGIPHDITAKILSYEGGIAVRNGCFCAQPYVQRLLNITPEYIEERINDPSLPHPGFVRISFGLYNTYQEVAVLIDILKKIVKDKDYYYKLYKNFDYDYFPK
ncbi:aminotransferase class V-fold PLP-dependent enzyme [Alkaliphilus peptidifermentans]|uniref:Selenocysteine lyase/Cysteine desulfurase n=1 Tax=Alkaliphilus peptidifermentans DSM 18978 TaxID=1120976 RepID=A0A1G5FJW5_9FIRM|nr:aminotransferase class V-fold PLP-dependent enzyme [Alkaliphilus peptidifermentans]SCY38898.1 Selenocysteine lyase/Cysteine desulfurase [Alkaliphilus peptidifermentans DSM 18978]